MFVSPGDIAFTIGSVSVYYYGIIMAGAIIVGVLTAYFVTKKYYPDLNPEIIYDISPHIIIGGIIGARLYYCLLSFDFYSRHPLEILQLWHGGLSIQGALLGGLLAGVVYAKRHKLPVLKLCDIFAYGVVLAQALGRWGNFFNSEAFGTPTNLPWKLYIPMYKRPAQFMYETYFHPAFLYESILNIFVFLILFFIIRRFTDKFDGVIFGSYLIMYSVARLFVEQLRTDSVLNIHSIPVAQIVCILTIAAASIMLLIIGHNKE